MFSLKEKPNSNSMPIVDGFHHLHTTATVVANSDGNDVDEDDDDEEEGEHTANQQKPYSNQCVHICKHMSYV